MTAQEIKEFCKEQGLTYKELAELIGMTEPSVKTALSVDKISNQIEASIKLLKKIKEQEQELKEFRNLKEILINLIKSDK
ncbi:TPA: helix-turn-helix transcriptional regulator [Campylobacter jejuni]|nr:helix-turn-helix transcriptional regulator [Campylobacter jejuni]HDZ5012308.1 helix-turn-helix transcriptional regulator [Campylobacter jejuni]HDZ5015983.1 helix-turn-helix transcriptional regulator [Campylobacter jejuni]HDZ5024121.1 helix-turn-helix transcriptional regulator [Campylobacter jejuni]HDZ5032222.1 helix-turn-helix transcriptional regulator [Campylobacter jejuni]